MAVIFYEEDKEIDEQHHQHTKKGWVHKFKWVEAFLVFPAFLKVRVNDKGYYFLEPWRDNSYEMKMNVLLDIT